RRLVGVIIGLTGLVVLFNPLAFDWTRRAAVLGNAAILAAALLWAASILHIRGHHWRLTPFDLLPWETLLATVILVPLAWLGAGPRWALVGQLPKRQRAFVGATLQPDRARERAIVDGPVVAGRKAHPEEGAASAGRARDQARRCRSANSRAGVIGSSRTITPRS